jgi:hypothetical protein
MHWAFQNINRQILFNVVLSSALFMSFGFASSHSRKFLILLTRNAHQKRKMPVINNNRASSYRKAFGNHTTYSGAGGQRPTAKKGIF